MPWENLSYIMERIYGKSYAALGEPAGAGTFVMGTGKGMFGWVPGYGEGKIVVREGVDPGCSDLWLDPISSFPGFPTPFLFLNLY